MDPESLASALFILKQQQQQQQQPTHLLILWILLDLHLFVSTLLQSSRSTGWTTRHPDLHPTSCRARRFFWAAAARLFFEKRSRHERPILPSTWQTKPVPFLYTRHRTRKRQLGHNWQHIDGTKSMRWGKASAIIPGSTKSKETNEKAHEDHTSSSINACGLTQSTYLISEKSSEPEGTRACKHVKDSSEGLRLDCM